MTVTDETAVPLRHADRFFIGGDWVDPSSDATIDVIDSATEEVFFRSPRPRRPTSTAPSPRPARAFDDGPWPRMTHAERAEYLRVSPPACGERAEDIGQIWPRESGALHASPRTVRPGSPAPFDYYAGLADTFPFEERAQPPQGDVRPAGARAGRRRRRDHPVERPDRPDHLQVGAGPAGRLHGGAQVLARGARRGLRGGRDRRGASACRPACSTSSPPTARSPSCWSATRVSTRSPSPARPRPGAGSPRSAASGSPAAPWSSAASPPPSSSTTST